MTLGKDGGQRRQVSGFGPSTAAGTQALTVTVSAGLARARQAFRPVPLTAEKGYHAGGPPSRTASVQEHDYRSRAALCAQENDAQTLLPGQKLGARGDLGRAWEAP